MKLLQTLPMLQRIPALGVVCNYALFKIESTDKPLSVNDINTRYLVQSFAGDALYRNELG